jgi:hypothetical protein
MTAGTPRFDRAQIRARLIGLLAALVVAPVVVLGLASVAAFDRAIEPELANRTRLIGTIVRSEIQRNLDLGIPVRALVGLDAYLAETLESFGEVDRNVVGATTGATIAEVERAEPAAPSLLLRAGLGEVVGLSHADFTYRDLNLLMASRI